jgi:hypothetical protein
MAILYPVATGYDDTLYLQGLINSNPSGVFECAGNTFIVSAPLVIPTGSRSFTWRNGNITLKSNTLLWTAMGLIAFPAWENSLFDSSTGHTTVGQHLIDYSWMQHHKFQDVWINGATNKTIAYYGNGASAGVGGYYGKWQGGYIGNCHVGIMADDTVTLAMTANANSVHSIRIQPSTGNFGIYLGQNSQNWDVHAWIESSGGTGIYLNGTGHTILPACRGEALTTFLSVNGGATGNTVFSSSYCLSGCGTNIQWSGSSLSNNHVI